jgi:hypothetical protein
MPRTPTPTIPREVRATRRARLACRGGALLLVGMFLASVARFYHPGTGFTALLGLPRDHSYETPALQRIPHYDYPTVAYDGQFYVQLALVPLLRDKAIDRAMDKPPYRARRILFSWTAWLLGFGRPAWIVEVYALQNVVCWLVLAWVLTHWVAPDDPRRLAAWTGCMFSHGLLGSVRFSVLDGPSLLLLACAVLAAERDRVWLSASILGAAGLARETNLLGALTLPIPASRGQWFRLAGAAAIVVVPILVWQDYLWSIYRSTSLAGGDQLTLPFTAYVGNWRKDIKGMLQAGLTAPPLQALLVIVALTVQLLFLVRSRSEWRNSWWRLAAMYALLMLIVNRAVWDGYPGAITRIVLPLTVGFNVLLVRTSPRRFWAWWIAGNLHLIPALHAMPFPLISGAP